MSANLSDEAYNALIYHIKAMRKHASAIEQVLDEMGQNRPDSANFGQNASNTGEAEKVSGDANINQSILPKHSRRARSPMPDEHIEACCKEGSNLWRGATTMDAASRNLVKRKMNPATAVMYLQAFSAMMEGVCYKRTISTRATGMYLAYIEKHFGIHHCSNAINAIRQHLEYQFEYNHGSRLEGIRSLIADYEKKLGD